MEKQSTLKNSHFLWNVWKDSLQLLHEIMTIMTIMTSMTIQNSTNQRVFSKLPNGSGVGVGPGSFTECGLGVTKPVRSSKDSSR